MPRVRPRLLLALLLPAAAQAQVVFSDFNLNSDGWLAYTGADPNTTIVYSAAGGIGGTGAIILQEPANGANDYFVAAPKFTGDMSAYYNGTLSLALKLNPAVSGSEAAMAILTGTYNSSPLSIGYLPPSNQYPITTSFTAYTLNLNTSTAWGLTNNLDFVTGTLATAAQIQSVLSTLTALRILGDWSNSTDLDLLDNVALTAIPEPSAWSLASATAAAAAVLATRRRRTPKEKST